MDVDVDENFGKGLSRGLLILDVSIMVLAFALGFVQGGLRGGFALLGYDILLSLIAILALVPFAGIAIFYVLAGMIPHFYTLYSYYHIVFLIESVIAWVWFVAMTVLFILFLLKVLDGGY